MNKQSTIYQARLLKLKSLLQELKHKGLNNRDIAIQAKMTPSALSNILTGRANLTESAILKLEDSLSLPRGYFDGELNEYIRISYTNESLIHDICFNKNALKSVVSSIGYNPNLNCLKLFNVTENSMAKTLEFGDTVIIDTSDTTVCDDLFLIEVNEKLQVKRLQLEKDRLVVISDNTKYKTWYINSQKDIVIVGRVVSKLNININRIL